MSLSKLSLRAASHGLSHILPTRNDRTMYAVASLPEQAQDTYTPGITDILIVITISIALVALIILHTWLVWRSETCRQNYRPGSVDEEAVHSWESDAEPYEDERIGAFRLMH
jgi:hypothetical protein